MEEKEIMPIIGWDDTFFGYIESRSYSGYSFVFCNEDGTKKDFAIVDYIILAVHPHYYSTRITSDTSKIIIINSNFSIETIGGSHFRAKCVQDIFPIGKSGIAFCTSEIINENKWGNTPHIFHPLSYINFKDSPKVINLHKVKYCPLQYYLFSIMGLHFVAESENARIEDPNEFIYSLLDEEGNTIHTWKKSDQIKCIWRRKDGSFTIISMSECHQDVYLHDYGDAEEYDNNKYCEITLTSIDNKYETLTYDDLKNEFEDKRKSPNYSFRYLEDIFRDNESPSNEEYLKWKRSKSISSASYVIKSQMVASLVPDVNFQYSEPNIFYSGLYCDDRYFLIEHSCGFSSFNPNKLLSSLDFSHLIRINKWDYEDSCYAPAIYGFEYGNGIVGFRLYKKYMIECSPEVDSSEYDKDMGNYKLYDIYGTCIGELDGCLIVSPANEIGLPQHYGVINSDFSIIIPPIFKEILPLDRYKLEVRIDNKGKTKRSEPSEFLYEYDDHGRMMGVIEDKRLYVVTQEMGYQGRIQCGIFEDGKELVPIGDNNIKRISGKYVLVKETSESFYTLYFHNGKVLYKGVRDAVVINLYNVQIIGSSSQIQYTQLTSFLHFSKVYLDAGFMIYVDDRILVDDIFLQMEPLFINSKDAYYVATRLDGKKILISINKGEVLSNFEGQKIIGIDNAFSKIDAAFHGSKYSYISHIVKNGDSLTDDEMYEINEDCWGYNHPNVHLNFDSKDAVLINRKGKYRIVRDVRNDVLPNNNGNDFLNEIAQMFHNHEIESLNGIVEGVSFLGRDKEYEQEDITLLITTEDKRCGCYSVSKGWLVQPEEIKYSCSYANYIVFNRYIINKYGTIVQFGCDLELVNNHWQLSAYFAPTQNKYVIIDDGSIHEDLQEDDSGMLVTDEYYDRYQIALNPSTKELFKINNPNHKSDDYSGPDPNEWTDEDSWDTMTDGQYGDYPGSGWDPEHFGY